MSFDRIVIFPTKPMLALLKDGQADGHPVQVLSWRLLYTVAAMKHRTQLYLNEAQYAWLKRRAGGGGSIAGVVRELVDRARAERVVDADDPLLRHLLDDPAGEGAVETSVQTLDQDLYGR
jgi:hypothetical protein